MLKWLLLSGMVIMVMSQDYVYNDEEIPDYVGGAEPVPGNMMIPSLWGS